MHKVERNVFDPLLQMPIERKSWRLPSGLYRTTRHHTRYAQVQALKTKLLLLAHSENLLDEENTVFVPLVRADIREASGLHRQGRAPISPDPCPNYLVHLPKSTLANRLLHCTQGRVDSLVNDGLPRCKPRGQHWCCGDRLRGSTYGQLNLFDLDPKCCGYLKKLQRPTGGNMRFKVSE